MSIFYDFIFIFILLLIVYFTFINKNRKEYDKLPDNSTIKSFIIRYDLDMRKTNYKTLLNVLSITDSFILAFGAVVVINIKSRVLGILIAFAVVIILIYSLYEILGRYFKKKEDEKNV